MTQASIMRAVGFGGTRKPGDGRRKEIPCSTCGAPIGVRCFTGSKLYHPKRCKAAAELDLKEKFA